MPERRGARVGLLGRGDRGVGGVGGLDACALLGGQALLGAADFRLRVGGHGGELGLKLLGRVEGLHGLESALEVLGEALGDAAQRHGGEADRAFAAVLGAGGVVVGAAPAGAERGLRGVIGVVAVARRPPAGLGRRRDRPLAARKAARLLVDIARRWHRVSSAGFVSS